MAPTHIGFCVFHLLLLGHPVTHFEFKQARLQHLHGLSAVAMLRAIVLALHHDVGGDVRNTNSRIGFVNVLTTCTAGAIGVNA